MAMVWSSRSSYICDHLMSDQLMQKCIIAFEIYDRAIVAAPGGDPYIIMFVMRRSGYCFT